MSGAARHLTVVVPTHNGAARIGSLLQSLSAQTISPSAMDVLIVDNGSGPDQAERIRSGDTFQAVRQRYGASVMALAEPGLTNARIAGARASRGSVVLFLDDDVLPTPGCCDAALRTFDAEDVGVAFGRVYPAYTREPPYSIRKREGILAVNHRLGDSQIVWTDRHEFVPTIGAALAVRRTAFLDAYPWQHPHLLLPDRVGTRLVSGGDLEIGRFLGEKGWRRVYNPAMTVRHAIDAERLRPVRFCRLIVGVERSQATFDCKFHLRSTGRRRARAVADLAVIALAAPFWCFTADGPSGWLYAIVSRLARIAGPYRCSFGPADDPSGAPESRA